MTESYLDQIAELATFKLKEHGHDETVTPDMVKAVIESYSQWSMGLAMPLIVQYCISQMERINKAIEEDERENIGPSFMERLATSI